MRQQTCLQRSKLEVKTIVVWLKKPKNWCSREKSERQIWLIAQDNVCKDGSQQWVLPINFCHVSTLKLFDSLKQLLLPNICLFLTYQRHWGYWKTFEISHWQSQFPRRAHKTPHFSISIQNPSQVPNLSRAPRKSPSRCQYSSLFRWNYEHSQAFRIQSSWASEVGK